ncbi:MAG: PadR family transcriptional regulator [Methanomicrobiaceae archaeon]|uniref:Transcriptional regulator, padr family n=1 Tax=hydrocarbon metagenome TaxID=938273 RepID=A0A0W8FEJ9_9ZZZZ|nr:PadR family transcriptional regulator [Methanomicrobiaceae archaeon]
MSLLTFASKHGKNRGLLTLYILHSLNREPKSGYDLRKEISEKTERLWMPSKGTLYPILQQLEEEGLILVCETGKRSKIVYCLTDRGRAVLGSIVQHEKASHDRLLHVKNLLFDIFGEEKGMLKSLYFELGTVIDALPPETEAEAISIVRDCHRELQRMTQHDGDIR